MSARSLYERFGGRVVKRAIRTGIRYGTRWLTPRGQLNILIPEQLVIVGRIKAIEYDCIRDGKLVKARHAFAPGANPSFLVGEGRGQLFMVGTANQFTDRGIIDFNRDGRPIDYNEKTGRISALKD